MKLRQLPVEDRRADDRVLAMLDRYVRGTNAPTALVIRTTGDFSRDPLGRRLAPVQR